MDNLRIEYRATKDLKPYDRNARTHSAKQIGQIAASIEQFGFNNPVLIDKRDVIIAGHGRVLAAKKLGQEAVPCLRLEHLSDAQRRAYILADNRIAEEAGWDPEILKIELQHLSSLDLEFDLTITGFEMAEIDMLLTDQADGDPADAVPAREAGPAVTQPRDIWQIGRHRLICGDATKPEAFAGVLEGRKANVIFTDPPYNVAISGHVGGRGKVQHREFAMAAGEMCEAAFTAFLQSVFEQLVAHSTAGSVHFICMDWRHMGEVLAAGKASYTELKNMCVWAKTNAGMGSLYRSQHELVFVYKSGAGSHVNNVALGRYGRNRTNVWSYAGANAFSASRDDDLAMHPTVKPVALVADAILDCSKRRDLVLDAFGGSGTTMLAAERTGRDAALIELDAHYCDVIVRRMREVAGLEARLAQTDQPFDEVARERAARSPRESNKEDT